MTGPQNPPDREPSDRVDVAVVGAGLAGLTAGLAAARAGASTLVLDAHRGGGRAAVRRVALDGLGGEALFNSGPRALYIGGEGRRVLQRLGVPTAGTKAPTKGSAALIDGRLDVLPSGVGSLLRTGIVSRASKPRLVAALLALVSGRARPGRSDESAARWIAERAGARDDVVAALAALFRVATYTADLDRLAADAAVAQVMHALGKGVNYLDGGFQQLLDGLSVAGTSAAMTVLEGCPVRSVEPGPEGSWTLGLGDGGEVRAESVVIAAGAPAAAATLLDRPDLLDAIGPSVTAACLELAVAAPVPTRFVLGIDEPLYLSEHCPPADLAPEGVSVVHVARYGSTDPAADRSRLEDLARQAGIRDEDVVARRFLAQMVVQTAMPSVHHGGLGGRPSVALQDRPGVFLAGDWVGPVGMLADASLASGETAGSLAAAHVGRSASAAAARADSGAGPGRLHPVGPATR